MLFQSTYKCIETTSNILYKSKGSKFIAFAFPVNNETDIKQELNKLKQTYPDATHHCYAWVLGYDQSASRANDDGEPSNSAGKPILRQILSFGLSNCLVVVVRYFGGTLLGVPGLIEAYGESSKAVLETCQIQTKTIYETYSVECEYGHENQIFVAIRQYQAELSVLDEAKCFSAIIKIPLQSVEAFKKQFNTLYQVKLIYKGLA